jgi:glucitol/sorbitol PTS system EIIA component
VIESKIVEIGELVPSFAEEMVLILFGPTATAELKSISVIHEFVTKPNIVLKAGTKFMVGNENQTYTITQVGAAANKNFTELGHISIYFSMDKNEILPGAILAEPKIYPTLNQGDTIRFYN